MEKTVPAFKDKAERVSFASAMDFVPNHIAGVLVNHKHPCIISGIIFAAPVGSAPSVGQVFVRFHNPDIRTERFVSLWCVCSDSIRNLGLPDYDILSGGGFYNVTNAFSTVVNILKISFFHIIFYHFNTSLWDSTLLIRQYLHLFMQTATIVNKET